MCAGVVSLDTYPSRALTYVSRTTIDFLHREIPIVCEWTNLIFSEIWEHIAKILEAEVSLKHYEQDVSAVCLIFVEFRGEMFTWSCEFRDVKSQCTFLWLHMQGIPDVWRHILGLDYNYLYPWGRHSQVCELYEYHAPTFCPLFSGFWSSLCPHFFSPK